MLYQAIFKRNQPFCGRFYLERVTVLCSNLFSQEEYIKQYLLDPDLPLIFKVKIGLRYNIASDLILQLNVLKEHLGKKLVIIINPSGFVVELNGKNLKVEKQDLKLIISLKEAGMLKVYYSHLYHLYETLRIL